LSQTRHCSKCCVS